MSFSYHTMHDGLVPHLDRDLCNNVEDMLPADQAGLTTVTR